MGTELAPNRARIDMKVPIEIRALLVAAAEVSYETLSGFLLHAGVLRAKQIIKDKTLVAAAEDALRRLPYVRY